MNSFLVTNQQHLYPLVTYKWRTDIKICGPIVNTSKSTKQFWMFNRIRGNCLIQLTVRITSKLPFQDSKLGVWMKNVMREKCENSVRLFKQLQRPSYLPNHQST